MIIESNEKIVEIDCSIIKDSISELIYHEGLRNKKVRLINVTSLYPDMMIIKYLKKIAGYQKMGVIIGKDNTIKSLKEVVRLLFIKLRIYHLIK